MMIQGTLKGLNDLGQPAYFVPIEGDNKVETSQNTIDTYNTWLQTRLVSDSVPAVSQWFFEASDGTVTNLTATFTELAGAGLEKTGEYLGEFR